MNEELVYMTKHGELRLFWQDERNLIWCQLDDSYKIPVDSMTFLLMQMNLTYIGEL